MGPSIDALQEDHIDFLKQFLDRAHNLHLELVLKLLRVAGHAIAAGGDIWAASGERRDHADARQSTARFGAVE